MQMPEYMRVRSYLYNLITRADNSDVQIPSENELCKLFEVSRNTVRGAIKGLVKDRYLIPKRGCGTFINPDMKALLGHQRCIVGIINGDGRPSIGNQFAPTIEKCILASGLRYEHFYLPESGNIKTFVESVKAGLDCVIWIGPSSQAPNYLKALVGEGVPALSLEFDGDPLLSCCDELYSDNIERGAEIADFLHARGHRNMLFVHDFSEPAILKAMSEGSTHSAYCKRMDALCGRDEHKTEVLSLVELESRLKRKKTSLRSFSIIYALAGIAPSIVDVLSSSGMSIPKDFSYLGYGESSPYFFNNLKPGCISIVGKISLEITKWLDLRLLKGSSAEPFSTTLAMDIDQGQTVRNLREEG